MAPSYRKIDYSLRPAKHAERRMLIEVFGRLGSFAPIDEYAYAGMGSVWFSDFILAHRYLGIRDMVSMEWPRGSLDRINDNIPFSSVTLVHQETSQALPNLNWNKRQIIWLDYDGLINRNVLFDVTTVVSRVRSGSVLAVSLQCNEADELDRAMKDGGADAVTRFRDTFGRDRVADIEEDDLLGWNFAELCRRLLLQEIEAALAARNLDVVQEEKLNYSTICSFEYADNAKMTTLLVAFFSESENAAFRRCAFDRLDFIRSFGHTVRIEMPHLTTHEMRWLKKQLPTDEIDSLDIRYLPQTDVRRFAKLYRYMPNFVILEA